jgi:hypothetical protein
MRALAAGIIAVILLALALLTWKLCFVQKPTAAPALSNQWHAEVYGLDPDEVVRFIPPPYSPQRMKDFARGWAGAPPKNELGQLAYHVLPTRTQQWGMSSARGTLLSALDFCNKMTLGDLEIPHELRKLPADGDWIIRIDAPMVQRMKAFESIISSITARNIVIEQKSAERNVIVARGRWQFHQVSGARSMNSAIHFYTDILDSQQGAGGGSGNLTQVFHRLEDIAHRKVIDEVTDRPTKDIEWANNNSGHKASQNEAALAQLLDNLSKQTSLEFVRTKRMIPIWFVHEKAATTQAINVK